MNSNSSFKHIWEASLLYMSAGKNGFRAIMICALLLFGIHENIHSAEYGSGPFDLSTPAGVTDIQWYKDGSAISAATNQVYSASMEGVYWARYTDASSGCDSTYTDYYIIATESATDSTSFNGPSGQSSYEWYKDSVLVASTQNFKVANQSSSTGIYYMNYDNGSCTISSQPMQLYILADCTANPYGDYCDTDGDGVDNTDDLDDDNDGILDLAENCAPAINLIFTNTLDISGTINGYSFIHYGTGLNGVRTSFGTKDLSGNTDDFEPAANMAYINVGGQYSGQVIFNTPMTHLRLLIDSLSGGNEWTFDEPFRIVKSGGGSPFTQSGNTLKLSNASDPDGSGTIEFLNTIDSFSYTSSGGDNTDVVHLAMYTCGMDTDGDGILNGFDLDSDGDGCPDAVESGRDYSLDDLLSSDLDGGNTSNGGLYIGTATNGVTDNLTGTITSADPVGDGIVTAEGQVIISGMTIDQPIGESQNGIVENCTDTDGDDIADFYDLDDDNDGILDVNENCSPGVLVSWTQSFSDVITINNPNFVASGLTLTGGPNSTLSTFNGFYLYNGASTGDLSAAQAGGNWIEGTFTTTADVTPDNIDIVRISHLPRGNVAFDWAFAISDDNFVTESILVKDQAHLSGNPVLDRSYTLQPGTTYNIRVYTYSSASGGGHRFDDLRLYDNSCEDVDQDGIPNSLDLDSDGDGCYDTFEAGVIGVTLNGTSSDSLAIVTTDTTGVGANGFANNLEDIDQDTAEYISTYVANYALDSTLHRCLDTDGDGVADFEDLDDDNDGVLDLIECYTEGANLETNSSMNGNVGANSAPTGWASYISNPSIPGTMDVNDLSTVVGGVNYTYAISPSSSSDGGTWVGIHDAIDPAQNYKEGIEKTFNLVAGNLYNITFEQANYGASGSSEIINSGMIEVLIDDGTVTPTTVVDNGGIMNLGAAWNYVSIQYTASTTGVHTLALRATSAGASISNYGAYMHIDGIKVIEYQPLSSCDTDNDGIANNLDLDSDGDGCYDSYEAGVTGATKDGSVSDSLAASTTAQVGANGFANSLETNEDGVYTGAYTYSVALDANDKACVEPGGIRLLCVDPLTDKITIKNFGTETIDISDFRVCSKFSYGTINTLNVISGSLNLAAGQEVEIDGFTLDNSAADLGLYFSTGAFSDTAAMADFTQWGSAGNGRESVAVSKGIWTAGDFIDASPQYCYIGNGSTENGVTYWEGSATHLKLKVLLQGALIGSSGGLMRDDLRADGLIPLAQPYNSQVSSRFTHVIGGTETTNNTVLGANAGTSDAIVDWVFVEIRDAADNTNVIRTVSALVQRDGDVVAAADGGDLLLESIPSEFFVSVKHRNHLGAATAVTHQVVGDSVEIDFTTMNHSDFFSNAGYETLAVAEVSGLKALWAGNVLEDNRIKYDGSAADRLALLQDVISHPENTSQVLNFPAAGYYPGDVNMDGTAKYDGPSNERILIQAFILGYPNNVQSLNNYSAFDEQIPE